MRPLVRQSFYLSDQLNFQFVSVNFQYKLDIPFEAIVSVGMKIQVLFSSHWRIYRIQIVFHLSCLYIQYFHLIKKIPVAVVVDHYYY